MRDRPDALELLEEAQRLLKDELAPMLEGQERFQALMIANALGIARREQESSAQRMARWKRDLGSLGIVDEAALVAGLRSGSLAGDPGVYEALSRDADARAETVSPKRTG